jgi:catechol 2,3-dioxygenase-like lactoylglutathione lyase family enzyme
VQAVQAGETRLLQHIVVAVPDLDAAVLFWTKGLGMKVTRTRQDDAGLRTVFVAFGDESFKVREELAGWHVKSSLGDAMSSLGDAMSSLGDAKSSLGDAKSSLGDAMS